MKSRLLALLALIAVVTLPGATLLAQTSAQPVFSTVPSAERIPNFDQLVSQLKQYHDCTCQCGCYAHDLDLQADRAIAFLQKRVTTQRPNEKLALVLDIDETSLSNYAEMLQQHYLWDDKVFDAWVNTAQAPAIPGTLRIDKEAIQLGVAVFFITGRPEDQRAATERNLRAVGYEWKSLTMRAPTEAGETAEVYKSAARARIAAQGYTIVLNVGDQWSDLKGKPEAEFSVKYPNPYYFIP
ncbi:MAG TPA: HAD family acid phosphatase [Terracidiphilus sp.]|nr:HAD family acid phosphatase [Terracidiphilus sp.]